jgi:hypothetical protein
VDKSEKVKQRWLKVLDNKEKLTYDGMLQKKIKLEAMIKREKAKRKKTEDQQEEMVSSDCML